MGNNVPTEEALLGDIKLVVEQVGREIFLVRALASFFLSFVH